MYWLEMSYDGPLGEIESIGSDGLVFIKRDTWAPGIWAGTEGAKILIDNKQYTIKEVLLNDAILKLDRNNDISPKNNVIEKFIF